MVCSVGHHFDFNSSAGWSLEVFALFFSRWYSSTNFRLLLPMLLASLGRGCYCGHGSCLLCDKVVTVPTDFGSLGLSGVRMGWVRGELGL